MYNNVWREIMSETFDLKVMEYICAGLGIGGFALLMIGACEAKARIISAIGIVLLIACVLIFFAIIAQLEAQK
jgi:hypothetical protein